MNYNLQLLSQQFFTFEHHLCHLKSNISLCSCIIYQNSFAKLFKFQVKNYDLLKYTPFNTSNFSGCRNNSSFPLGVAVLSASLRSARTSGGSASTNERPGAKLQRTIRSGNPSLFARLVKLLSNVRRLFDFHFLCCCKPAVLNLGYAYPQGYTRSSQGVRQIKKTH